MIEAADGVDVAFQFSQGVSRYTFDQTLDRTECRHEVIKPRGEYELVAETSKACWLSVIQRAMEECQDLSSSQGTIHTHSSKS